MKKDLTTISEQQAKAGFAMIRETKSEVHSGDLVLRNGRDFASEVIRRLSEKDQTYSHCGIANWENDTLFVYHALGGEWNPDEKLRRDSYELFCNPYENRGFGIFRYDLNPGQQQQFVKIAREFYRQQIRFDMQFDLATDDKMYCSEFVYKAFEKASNDSLKITTTLNRNFKFVAVDNLFMNAFCHPVKKVVF